MTLLETLVYLVPVIPLLTIFVRRIFNYEPLNILMGLCLLALVSSFLRMATSNPLVSAQSINNIEFIFDAFLLIMIYRSTLGKGPLKSLLLVIIIAFISVVATIGAISGIQNLNEVLLLLIRIVMLLVSVWFFFIILNRYQIDIFSSALFWITSGAIIFYFIEFFVQINTMGSQYSASLYSDLNLLHLVVYSVKYMLFGAAAVVHPEVRK